MVLSSISTLKRIVRKGKRLNLQAETNYCLRLTELMEFLFVKDKSEGKITGRTSWKEDSEIRKSLKKRAAALVLDFENNRDLLNRQVRYIVPIYPIFNFLIRLLIKLFKSVIMLNVSSSLELV